MKTFSQRKGLEPVKTTFQVEGMDNELRNSLWNVFDLYLWNSRFFYYTYPLDGSTAFRGFCKSLWVDFFKEPVDTRSQYDHENLHTIRERFFSYKWNKVYEFIEFVLTKEAAASRITAPLNDVLNRELAGYRIINGIVADITNEQEVQMLAETLQDSRFEGVTAHLKRALELLSDKKNPDARNSIKESISAVESIAQVITDKPGASLGDALAVLEKKGELHAALKKGFSNLYGYTSDADGIRHAMLKESNITQADAKFFLLSCTSFVNYLKSKM